MIIDSLGNCKCYEAIHGDMRKAFEFVKNQNLMDLEVGKYEIDGDRVFMMIQSYDTKDEKGGAWEAHKRYLDIQYIIEGTEKINVANIDKMEVLKAYDEKDDFWLFSGYGDAVTLEAGMFAIFFPQDVHMPGIKINESKPVKKAVIKVLL